MTPRRRGLSRLVSLGVAGTAAAATFALTQVTASGAFSDVEGNLGNSVSAAASFCTAAPTTLTSSGDSWTDEAATGANHQNNLELKVRSSSSGDRRIWIGFALPGAPSPHCAVTEAKLRMYNKVPVSGRNIDVHRGATSPLWAASTITWSNQPGSLGPAVTNAATPAVAGWQEWVVTDHVLAQYAGVNNGFMLRDRTENSATSSEQVYYDRQDATYRPTLVLTWG